MATPSVRTARPPTGVPAVRPTEFNRYLGGGDVAVPLPALDLLFTDGAGGPAAGLPPEVVFSRSVLARQYVYSQLTDFAVDVPRLNEFGFLMERQTVYTSNFSSDCTEAPYNIKNATIQVTTEPGQQPSTTMQLLTETNDASAVEHDISQGLITTNAGAEVTFSVLVKANGRDEFFLQMGDPTDRIEARFNITTQAITDIANVGTGSGAVASMQDRGSGRWQLNVSGIPSTTLVNLTATTVLSSGGVNAYQGNGVSGAYVTDYQVMGSPYPASLARTDAGDFTRTFDAATVPTASFDFNTEFGTLYVEGVYDFEGSGDRNAVALNDGTTITTSQFGAILLIDSNIVFETISGVVTQAQISIPYTIGTYFKAAYRIQENNFAACLNGGTVLFDTTGTPPSTGVTTLGIGTMGGNNMDGVLVRATYFKEALSNTQLQLITAPDPIQGGFSSGFSNGFG